MEATGLRVLIPSRKSRKGDADEDTRYARQEAKLTERAERDGHFVVTTVRDTVSSQTMPWERKSLKKWFTDPAKLALWDAVYVETDRLSRGTDKQWHDIESFCYDHDKKIITAEGVQFPPRDDADRYQWVGLKRRARVYWEDVRDKHSDSREIVKANGGAIGRPNFGYTTAGEKLNKRFVPHEVNAELAREVFQRIADGHTATSVAGWLGLKLGKKVRPKFVTDMIRRDLYYTGQREHFTFEPLVTRETWEQANGALSARSFVRTSTGRKTEHGYSGLIFCQCGAPLYRHQSSRDGRPVGLAKYRCAAGRRGDVTESRCQYGAAPVDVVDDAINTLMSRCDVPERVLTTTGGDHARKAELSRIQADMEKAMKAGDMAEVTRLAAEFQTVSQRPAEPIKTVIRETGRSWGDVWRDADLSDRRALLERGDFIVSVREESGAWVVDLDWTDRVAETMSELVAQSGLCPLPPWHDSEVIPLIRSIRQGYPGLARQF